MNWDLFNWILIGGLFLIVIGLGSWFLWYTYSFKNRLIVRSLTNNRKVIKVYRWKERKNKNGSKWLITPFQRIKTELPPNDAIEINSKGRLFVECWAAEDSESLIWVKDGFNYDNYLNKENKGFDPLTTTHRELLINEIAKSREYEGKTTWDRIIQISMWLVPIIMVLVISLTIGDITSAINEYRGPLDQTLKGIGASFERAAENLASVQTVPINQDINVTPPN